MKNEVTPEFDALARPLFERASVEPPLTVEPHVIARGLLYEAARATLPDVYVDHLITILCATDEKPESYRDILLGAYSEAKRKAEEAVHEEELLRQEKARFAPILTAAEAFAERLLRDGQTKGRE